MPPRPIMPTPALTAARVTPPTMSVALRTIPPPLPRPPRSIPPAHRAIPQTHATHNRLVARHKCQCLGLAELLRTTRVCGVERGVEEIAHGLDDGACGEEVGHRAGAVAVQGGGEGAGFDELRGVLDV